MGGPRFSENAEMRELECHRRRLPLEKSGGQNVTNG